MARGGGIALKFLQWFLRIIEFCCAAIILGIFSYFLAALHDHNLGIAEYIRAVEGISGAGVLYTIIALLFLFCLAGIAFFSFLAIILDIAFIGAFIYIAWATRGGDGSCNGFVNTPLGSGIANSNTITTSSPGFVRLPSLRFACRLNTACFAVAIVAIVFFFLSIFVELALIRHHRKERAFGPSPNNGYTAGSPRRKFWQRRPKNDAYMTGGVAGKRDPDSLPMHQTPADIRDSYNTEATMVPPTDATYDDRYRPTAPVSAGTHPNPGYPHSSAAPGTVEMPAEGRYKAYNPNGTF